MTAPDSTDINVNRFALKITQYFASNATTLVLQFSLSSLLFGERDAFPKLEVTILIIFTGILTILAFTSISLLL